MHGGRIGSPWHNSSNCQRDPRVLVDGHFNTSLLAAFDSYTVMAREVGYRKLNSFRSLHDLWLFLWNFPNPVDSWCFQNSWEFWELVHTSEGNSGRSFWGVKRKSLSQIQLGAQLLRLWKYGSSWLTRFWFRHHSAILLLYRTTCDCIALLHRTMWTLRIGHMSDPLYDCHDWPS